MKNLIIIGARGFGREVWGMAQNCVGYGSEFVLKGFLDDKSDALDETSGYGPILDSVENYRPLTDDVFVCALGNPRAKEKYVNMILDKGGDFISLVHNTSSVRSPLGPGCIVCAYCLLSCDMKIGSFNTFQGFSVIGHDVSIGNFCELETRTFMGGYSQLGDRVTLHTNAVVHPKIKIGNDATVGALSVVIRNVRDNTTVYGNPAIRLKY